MKKILLTVILFSASLLLFITSPLPVHAVPHQEQFTLVKDPDFDYNIDLYGFLQYAYANYDDGVHPELLVDIDVLTYSTSSVSKAADVFTLTFDTYVIVVDGTTITSTGAAISDGTYVLDFYLEYETYQDLFYSTKDIEFEILTSNTITSGTYDLFVANEILNSENDIIDIYINDIRVGGSNNYNGANYIWLDNPNMILISEYDYIDSMLIQIYEDDTFSEVDYSFEIGDTLRIVSKKLKTWTQAHDYGRIRTNTSTLYLNQPSETAAFLSHSESTNVINVSNIAVGDEIVMQSPYSDFSVSYGNIGFPRTYLVEQENIAAVKMIKNAADNTDYTFVLYYWESGGVTSRVISNVNLANRNSLNIQFKGGFRKALDGTAAAVASVDENYDVNVFLSELSAWDDIDGDISDQIYIIEDNYTPNIGTIGVFTVLVGVMDSEEQESTLLLTITVMDLTAPTGPASNTVTAINYTTTFNLSNYISTYIRANFTDNYNDPEDLVITVKTDNYTPNKTTIGNKTVVFEVKDTSGNAVEHTLTIPVIDQVAPAFTAGVQTLSKSVNEVITVAQLVATQTVMDAIDGNVSSSIIIVSDNYTANANTPGTYEVILRAFDNSNNQVTRTITINVFSGVPGWYIPNDGPLIIPDGTVLTQEQLETVLLSVGWLSNDVPYTFITSNYFENSGTPGTYSISYMIDGQQTTFNLLVLNQGDNWFPDVPNPPVQTGLSNGWIIGLVAVGVLGAAGLVYYLYKKKK